MQSVSFSPRFFRALALCRYAVYAGLGALLVLGALRRGDDLSSILRIVPVYCLAVPVLLQAILPLASVRALHVGLHALEWLLMLSVLVICGMSMIAAVMVMVVVLAANTALWGWRQLGLLLTGGAVVVAFLHRAGIALSGKADALIDASAGAAAVAFVLTVCAVAHAQANRLVKRGSLLKSEKQALLRYLPKDLSAHIGGTTRVRREWLTVAFIDLVGFSRATQELPAEALVILLNDFLGGVNSLVEQWDGTVSKFLGDGVLCVFASSNTGTRANAAVQAVRCLTLLPGMLNELNARWRAQGFTHAFAVTSGVASGYCCAGDWGGDTRLDYTVIGAPVNLACRLQGQAGGSGGILLDCATAGLVGDAVAVQPGMAVDLKGMGLQQAFPLGAADITVGCQPLLC